MPTVIKSTSNISKLGELSTYTVSNAATPADPSDSSGSVPGFSAVLANGTDTEFLIGETLNLSNPAIGTYAGEIIAVNKAENSARYSLDANTLLARLNNDVRVYPLNDVGFVVSTNNPLAALEYWTQQCGVLYDKIDGDVLFYQSQSGHGGAYVKGVNRAVRNFYKSGATTPVVFASIGNGRQALSYGVGAESDVNFTAGSYLNLLVPSGTANVMVFGGILYFGGTARQGITTWNMQDNTGRKLALRVTADTAVGFTLAVSEDGTTYTNVATVPETTAGTHRVYLAVSAPTATQTQFTLSVYNFSQALVGTVQSTQTSNIRGSLSLTSIVYTSGASGSGDLMVHYGDFISIMTAIPSTFPPVQKSLTPGYKSSGPLIGFSGNAWEHIKQYCSLYHLEISCANGIITVGPRPKEITSGIELSTLGTKIQARDQARYVEVVNQQHKATNTTPYISPQVLWKADTVYQVAVGEIQTFTVQTKHSILNTLNPVCVSGISPYPYTTGSGQYVVTGSDGYIVSPSFWAAQGGSITADTTENEGEIKITIKGPDYDSPRAPYRISEGDAGRPALYITGEGVLCDPVTLRVSTGNTKAAKEVGVTLDSPFIGTPALAYDAAMAAAVKYAVPGITASIAEPTGSDEPSSLGQVPSAGLIRRNGNILRVTDTSQTKSGLTGNTSQHNTIYQINNSYGSATIGDMNALNAGKTIGQLNIRPLKS